MGYQGDAEDAQEATSEFDHRHVLDLGVVGRESRLQGGPRHGVFEIILQHHADKLSPRQVVEEDVALDRMPQAVDGPREEELAGRGGGLEEAEAPTLPVVVRERVRP